jgi:hypothetical protein
VRFVCAVAPQRHQTLLPMMLVEVASVLLGLSSGRIKLGL